MRIQTIVFPQTPDKQKQELYYRSNKKIIIQHRRKAILEKGTIISFDTYFNALSSEKWKCYTPIREVIFCSKIKGNCHICLVEKKQVKEEWENEIIVEWDGKCEEETLVQLSCDLALRNGIVFVKIEAKEDSLTVSEPKFFTELQPVRKVNIAAVICTYHREEFLKRNIRILNDFLLENSESTLSDKLDIYVIDN